MFILAMVSRNGSAEPVSHAMGLLQKGTTAERRHAAGVLAQIGDQRAGQVLAQALRDADVLVRETIARINILAASPSRLVPVVNIR
jgi:HEAT repeat protein